MKIVSLSFLLSVGILFTQGCSEPTETKAVKNQKTTKLQHCIDSLYSIYPETIGIAAHIEMPDSMYSESFVAGYSEKSLRDTLRTNHSILIASNTKTYVSASILKLQELGKLTIEDAIDTYLRAETDSLFRMAGYKTNKIKIKHLLSHTSGIKDYVNDAYVERVKSEPMHRWTRDEQLQWATTHESPLGDPGFTFSYADANYLLLTEVIEHHTKKEFYLAMRDLLRYDKLGLENTWFSTLEEKPYGADDLAHQYWSSEQMNSNEMDHSFDLYGGGGIATSIKELAKFNQALFEGSIIDNQDILNLIYTEISTQDSLPADYYLGISLGQAGDYKTFGHGGFWGTTALYIPELNATISLVVLERDVRAIRTEILDALVLSLE